MNRNRPADGQVNRQVGGEADLQLLKSVNQFQGAYDVLPLQSLLGNDRLEAHAQLGKCKALGGQAACILELHKLMASTSSCASRCTA